MRIIYSPLTEVLCMRREKKHFNLVFKASSLDVQKEGQTDTHLCVQSTQAQQSFGNLHHEPY